MPLYSFQHPTNGKVIQVIQHMNDKHVYSEDGVEWKRVWEVPAAKIDTLDSVDPFDKQEFIRRTGNMKSITQGDLWDISAELSRKREKKLGKDPVKEKAIQQYAKKTGGKAHPHAPRNKSKHFDIV